MGSQYQHQSQRIVLSHDSNTKYMVKRSLFNLRIYTTRRDIRNHFTSVSLVLIFLVFMRFFFSRMKKRVQSNMLYSVDFYNLKLYKFYNKYFCLTYSIWNKTRFLFLSIQQRQKWVFILIIFVTGHRALFAEIPSRIRDNKLT